MARVESLLRNAVDPTYGTPPVDEPTYNESQMKVGCNNGNPLVNGSRDCRQWARLRLVQRGIPAVHHLVFEKQHANVSTGFIAFKYEGKNTRIIK